MIILKSKSELELMRIAGRIVAETLHEAEAAIRPGITTDDLDRLIDAAIRGRGAIPSFKGLYGFPASACISVNEEIVHGIPGRRTLKAGDIVSLDVGAQHKGFHADGAWTFPVGTISPATQRLLDVTHTALFIGLAKVTPDGRILDISQAIQDYVEGQGYNLIRDYQGHGVGRSLHEEPNIPNWLDPNGSRPPNVRMKPGMTFAVEPMVVQGRPETVVRKDKWTVATVDRALSAHFEHTVVVTASGYDILTQQ
ncbi:MAG: type I methionyl aminopeptidase [Anaerolineae bacterium]